MGKIRTSEKPMKLMQLQLPFSKHSNLNQQNNQNFIEWKIWRRVQIPGKQSKNIVGKNWKIMGILFLAYSPVAVNIKLIVFSLDFLLFGRRNCHKQVFLFLKSYRHFGLIFHKNDGNHVKRHHIKLWIPIEQYTALIFKVGRKKTVKVKTAHFSTFVAFFFNSLTIDKYIEKHKIKNETDMTHSAEMNKSPWGTNVLVRCEVLT